MAKTKIWYTRDGRDVQVRQMETEHLERCIARIMRSRILFERWGAPFFWWRPQYLKPLLAELERRRAYAKLDMWSAALDYVINENLRG